jgi:hypothetical protein
VAPLPQGIAGHFGPELRRFVLLQHHQGQVTVERLTAQLRAVGFILTLKPPVDASFAHRRRRGKFVGVVKENRGAITLGGRVGKSHPA